MTVAAIATGAIVVRALEAVPASVFGLATVVGGTPQQVKMVRWAVGRFEAAGLTLPSLEIRFHGDFEGCGGNLGFYRGGGVDVCRVSANLMARQILLHEMSHGWAEANVTGRRREAFLEVRGLQTWIGDDTPWGERGGEHAAEIMAWYLGDRILMPTVPDNGPEQLEGAVAVLLGGDLPSYTTGVLWGSVPPGQPGDEAARQTRARQVQAARAQALVEAYGRSFESGVQLTQCRIGVTGTGLGLAWVADRQTQWADTAVTGTGPALAHLASLQACYPPPITETGPPLEGIAGHTALCEVAIIGTP